MKTDQAETSAPITTARIMPPDKGSFAIEFAPEVQAISLLPTTSGFIPRRKGPGLYNLRIEPVAAAWLNCVLMRPVGDRVWGWNIGGSLTAVIAAATGGANIVYTDPQVEPLAYVRQQVAPQNQGNLRTEFAPAYETSLYDETISYILCTGVLGHLDPERCEALIRKMFAVAKEGGQVFVESFSYRSSRTKRIIKEFEAREKAGEKFPGWGLDVTEPTRGRIGGVLNLYSPDVLRSLFQAAGWTVDHCAYEGKSYKDWIKLDGQEFVTLHATKPK